MKNHLLISSLLLTGTLTTQAQVRSAIGPQLGYTLFTTDYHDGDYQNNTGYRSNFAAGLLAEVGVGHLSIQLAPRYTRKGYSIQQTSYRGIASSSQVRLDYLALPLSIGYTQRKDGQGVQVFAGAYLGYLLGGHYDAQSTVNGLAVSQSGPVVSEKDTNTSGNAQVVRRLDWGIQAGAGYRYQQLLVQVEYQIGLQNVDPNNSSGTYIGYPNYYNRGFQLSLAYLFGSKS